MDRQQLVDFCLSSKTADPDLYDPNDAQLKLTLANHCPSSSKFSTQMILDWSMGTIVRLKTQQQFGFLSSPSSLSICPLNSDMNKGYLSIQMPFIGYLSFFIPVNLQVLNQSGQPIWHQESYYSESQFNPRSSPCWSLLWTFSLQFAICDNNQLNRYTSLIGQRVYVKIWLLKKTNPPDRN